MSLNDIKLKLSYNSGDNNLINGFFIPCFKNSIKYDRAVGFFSSEILTILSKGLHEFLLNSGTMRLICSPRLNKEDIEAIEKGYQQRDDIIQGVITREVERIPEGIIYNSLNCLSWLIANNRLDIRIALPRNISYANYGIYHEKIGAFYDDSGNVIAFSGSQNETLYGATFNYESFDVYRSWVEQERCNIKINHFNKLWENDAAGIDILHFPEAAKKKIISKIIPQEYSEIGGNYVFTNPKDKIDTEAYTKNLWYFQKDAIESWKKNSCKGMFSMATGTGKTKTAIGGVIELKKTNQNILVVIACPQNTIMKQWENEIENLNLFNHSVIADSTNTKWKRELANYVLDYNDGHINNCIVYTTYQTLSSDKFTSIINQVTKPSLLICDEVHWVGADIFSKGLLPMFKYRLGLSATPVRYMDEEGSDKISAYFDKVAYEFTLKQALTA